MQVPLGQTSFIRKTAKDPEFVLRNRYFEQDPTDQATQVDLLARPAMRRWLEIGSGPIRGVYSQIGSFDDAVFVVSGEELYRVNIDETTVFIRDGIFGDGDTATVSMAATGNIGSTPAYLFIADGKVLWVYDGVTATQVEVPDDLGVVSVGYINGYVICVVAQGQGVNGRFFWINPGETTIDPLDFATAERSPDPLHQVVVVGDQFWLPGETTTEVWYTTGNFDAPMARVQGRLFDRGVWAGTAVQVKDAMILVDTDGVVYSVSGGAQRVSDNSVEERIRKAMELQVIKGDL